MEIFVVGKQWMWKVQHADGQREINELHVPVGRPVKLIMGSEDVIHSFYIPAFRVKADVIPGRYNTLWFQATKPGRYHLFCAEYCGTKHSGMIGSVVAMEPADYQAWLSGGPAADSPVAAGEKLFQSLACITCHMPTRRAADRSWTNLFGHEVELQGGGKVVADEAYLRESIVLPQAKVVAGFQPIMPPFQGHGDGRAAAAADRVPEVAEGSGPASAVGHRRRSRSSGMHMEAPRTQLSEQRPRRGVVAVDEGPQAHRAALPGVDHRLLRDRRRLRDDGPARAADAGAAT